MSVSEADIMTVLGETQPSTTGSRQESIAADIERQHAYEQSQRETFGTAAELGPQLLAQAVPFITGSALGSVTSFGIGGPTPSRLWQQEGGIGSVGDAPPIPRQTFPGFPEEGPAPRGRLPVPYEPPPQPGPFAFGIGGIGAILGGVIAGMWEGWPNALGDEPGPYPDVAPAGTPLDPTNVPDVGELGPPPPDALGPPFGGEPYDNPPLPSFPDFGNPGVLNPEDIDAGPIPDSSYGPPQGARQPAPAPAPAAPAAPGLPRWVWPTIGAIGAIGLGRRSRSSLSLPSINVAGVPGPPGLTLEDLTPLIESLLPSATSTLTSSAPTYMPMTASGGVWDTAGGQDSCNCSPRKGKKRRCLARAQLTWRSGPKKGRAAGSRCYRFAD